MRRLSDPTIITVSALWATILLNWSAAPAVAAAAKAPADVVILNGRIVTEDANDRIVDAMAIRDGRVLALGSSTEVRRLANTRTRVIDLHGMTATPGLIDTHAHLSEGAEALRSVSLSDATTIAQVRARVAAQAAKLAKGQWLLGTGWDEGKLAEKRYVLAADLDDAAPDNPVWLEHTTGHYGVANSRALAMAGVTADTANPTAGTIDRDATGKPTGVLKEAAQGLVRRLVPEPSIAEYRDGILDNIRLMHSEGMTGVKDPAIEEPVWEAYTSLAREGKLAAHVCVLWRTDPTLDAASKVLARIRSLPRHPAPGEGTLGSCGLKLFMDGSGGARTAWMYDDWHRQSTQIDVGNKGYPAIDPDVYRQVVRLYHQAGVPVATHAIGDRAIDWVVDTYAQVLAENPVRGMRHAIIHANTPSEHAIDEMARLQKDFDAGYPETQAPFTWWIGDNYAGNLGPQRAARLNPYATYVRRGIRFGGGSDYSVTPLPARYGLWASVARTTLLGTFGAQPFGTSESISAADALRSYTRWAAPQLFLEADTGSLEIGKSADLAVWDKDPLTAATPALKDLKCQLTLFQGRIVYQAVGSPVTVSGPQHR